MTWWQNILLNNLDQFYEFEKDLLSSGKTSLKPWFRLIDGVSDLQYKELLYQRAIIAHPYSYKLWMQYMDFITNECQLKHIGYDKLVGLYEVALVSGMNTYPEVWLQYAQLTWAELRQISLTRSIYDRALLNLPVTQHTRVWIAYRQFVVESECIPLIEYVYRRLISINQMFMRDLIRDLVHLINRLSDNSEDNDDDDSHNSTLSLAVNSCVKWIRTALNSPLLVQTINKRNKNAAQELWIQLSNLIIKYVEHFKSDLDIPSIIQDCMERVKLDGYIGQLYASLASYYVRQSSNAMKVTRDDHDDDSCKTQLDWLNVARQVYRDALDKVNSATDFSIVYEAFVEFEEGIISAVVEHGVDLGVDFNLEDNVNALEQLLEDRELLLNNVRLRQNPNNVIEWQRRIRILLEQFDNAQDQDSQEQQDDNGADLGVVIENTFKKCLNTIDPYKASGKLHDLWIQYGDFVETLATQSAGNDEVSIDLSNCRQVFEQALNVPYRFPDQLAEVYIHYANMELKHGNHNKAIQILARGTTPPEKILNMPVNKVRYTNDSIPVQHRIFKSLKLWNHYMDLVEVYSTVDVVRAAYDQMIELKVVVPQNIVNYAIYLESNGYHEDSFRVYEKGIDLFGYPYAFEFWNLYLDKFVQRYLSQQKEMRDFGKLERARDLFERALVNCPQKFLKKILLFYAQVEEQYGQPRRALKVYERAVALIQDFGSKQQVYKFYIIKAVEFFGYTYVRPIYDQALQDLHDEYARPLAMDYIAMELKLGEYDRVRSLYEYTSQMCDPQVHPQFWTEWEQFEVEHGDEDSYKDMLRIKRNIVKQLSNDAVALSKRILQQKLTEEVQFVPSSSSNVTGGHKRDADEADLSTSPQDEDNKKRIVANDEEIVISDIE
ncbi:hypothetical protein MP228_010814 [Amoeboaphelidium protococcarum]|nr:hypothetical protein MP228_010814 [Amoeboaphelidium protococcarum]